MLIFDPNHSAVVLTLLLTLRLAILDAHFKEAEVDPSSTVAKQCTDITLQTASVPQVQSPQKIFPRQTALSPESQPGTNMQGFTFKMGKAQQNKDVQGIEEEIYGNFLGRKQVEIFISPAKYFGAKCFQR